MCGPATWPTRCSRNSRSRSAQGAKPGEGGQLPAPKVTVEIAAARGGTPGVELVSPPPHHDTYSIEDLAQLIHDCKAARVRVIVKLVSSEGIGTIAVGVAKAGADVINVAGNTGGTGAAAVTSLKYAGRSAEIGVAEVHQALCANGLRQKVLLRCSGAHQTGERRREVGAARRRQLRVRYHRADDAQVRHGQELQHQVPGRSDHQSRSCSTAIRARWRSTC